MQDALSEVYRYQGGHWRESNCVGNARDCPPQRRSGQLADYYPFITQAVNRLEQSTAETRGTIYDRARVAMVALRGVTPPLSESDINREQLALEIALRKVEAESLRRSRTPQSPSTLEPNAPSRPSRESGASGHLEPFTDQSRQRPHGFGTARVEEMGEDDGLVVAPWAFAAMISARSGSRNS